MTVASNPLVISLCAQLRPTYVAARTRAAYDAGITVYWTATKHAVIKRAATALGDWYTEHSRVASVPDEGRVIVMFVPGYATVAGMSYFPKRRPPEHVLVCSECGAADHGWAWSEPSSAPPEWACGSCGSTRGETREIVATAAK